MIATQLDSTYARWLDPFLSSLQLTNPDIPTSVELVNFHPRLADFFPPKDPATRFEAVTPADASRHILARRKVDAALSTVRRHPRQPWFLACDVDLLFRKPIGALIDESVTHDCAVAFRDGYWEGRQYEHLG